MHDDIVGLYSILFFFSAFLFISLDLTTRKSFAREFFYLGWIGVAAAYLFWPPHLSIEYN